MRIMGDSAKMAATMVKRNVVPESGGTWVLPRLIGWGKAAEIFFRGLTLDAQKCLDLGIANTVVPTERLPRVLMARAPSSQDTDVMRESLQ
jgi:enoyl-CoA hydratase/carnithine racemase